MLFKYKPPFSIDQFFALGMPERKFTFVLDCISLVKTKHSMLNKRSSSLKPKSVTFKEEEENLENGANNKKLDMYSTLNPSRTSAALSKHDKEL